MVAQLTPPFLRQWRVERSQLIQILDQAGSGPGVGIVSLIPVDTSKKVYISKTRILQFALCLLFICSKG
jgi:hypothetical protein